MVKSLNDSQTPSSRHTSTAGPSAVTVYAGSGALVLPKMAMLTPTSWIQEGLGGGSEGGLVDVVGGGEWIDGELSVEATEERDGVECG